MGRRRSARWRPGGDRQLGDPLDGEPGFAARCAHGIGIGATHDDEHLLVGPEDEPDQVLDVVVRFMPSETQGLRPSIDALDVILRRREALDEIHPAAARLPDRLAIHRCKTAQAGGTAHRGTPYNSTAR